MATFIYLWGAVSFSGVAAWLVIKGIDLIERGGKR
jgi:hypothetical protein